jgi:hypothetical protein
MLEEESRYDESFHLSRLGSSGELGLSLVILFSCCLFYLFKKKSNALFRGQPGNYSYYIELIEISDGESHADINYNDYYVLQIPQRR